MWPNKQRITETEFASKITADRQLVKQTSCALLSLAATASSWTVPVCTFAQELEWTIACSNLLHLLSTVLSLWIGLVWCYWRGGYSIDASLLALLFYSCLVLAFDAVMWKEM